jgi:hypothetical protein
MDCSKIEVQIKQRKFAFKKNKPVTLSKVLQKFKNVTDFIVPLLSFIFNRLSKQVICTIDQQNV